MGSFFLFLGTGAIHALETDLNSQDKLNCETLLRFAQAKSLDDIDPSLGATPQSDYEEVEIFGRDSLDRFYSLAQLTPSMGGLIFSFISTDRNSAGLGAKVAVDFPILQPEYEMRLKLEDHSNGLTSADGNLLAPVSSYLFDRLLADDQLSWVVSEESFRRALFMRVRKELERMGVRAQRVPVSDEAMAEFEGEMPDHRTELFVRVSDKNEVELSLALLRDPLFIAQLSAAFPWDDFVRFFDWQGEWEPRLEIRAEYERRVSFRPRELEAWEPQDLSGFAGKAAAEVIRQQYGYVVRFHFRLLMKPKK